MQRLVPGAADVTGLLEANGMSVRVAGVAAGWRTKEAWMRRQVKDTPSLVFATTASATPVKM